MNEAKYGLTDVTSIDFCKKKAAYILKWTG